MCIIVDASRLGDFVNPNNNDSAPIRKWLARGGKLIYSTGGKFATEVGQTVRRRLAEYVRAGSAELIPHDQLIDDVRAMKACTYRKSNDAHVLALAKSTGTRLLYTGDDKLMEDFKNTRILKPKGKIYSSADNASLLNRTTCGNRRTR